MKYVKKRPKGAGAPKLEEILQSRENRPVQRKKKILPHLFAEDDMDVWDARSGGRGDWQGFGIKKKKGGRTICGGKKKRETTSVAISPKRTRTPTRTGFGVNAKEAPNTKGGG